MSDNKWTYHFLNATTFVLGNRKNAGKTTFMNLVLNHIRQVKQPAICSIGIDGESTDHIDGQSKPLVHTQSGDYVVTTRPMLNASNAQYALLKAFPYRTVLGQLVIAQTLRSGTIELVGPENNLQLSEIIQFLQQELKCNTIIVDGAASRLTPVSAIKNAGFMYVVNADRRNLSKALDTMKRLSLSDTFLSESDNTNRENVFAIEGALTSHKLQAIPENCQTLCIDNITSIFLSYKQLAELNKRVTMVVKNRYQLKAFVVILKDIKVADFKQMYVQNQIKTELIINPYVD